MYKRESGKYRRFLQQHYVSVALAASFCFAGSGFGISLISASGITAAEYVGQMCFGALIMLIYCVCFHAALTIQQNRRIGVVWSKQLSAYWIPSQPEGVVSTNNTSYWSIGDLDMSVKFDENSEYRFNWKALGFLTLKACLFDGGAVFYWIASYSAYASGTNFAIITSLTGLNPFLISILFYFTFDERLHKYHFIGIGLLTLSLLINCGSSIISIGVTVSETNEISGLVPIFSILVSSMFFVLANWSVRYLSPKAQMTSFQFQTDSMFIASLIQLCILICIWPEFEWDLFVIVSLSVVMSMMAFGLITEALTYGKGGPAQAVGELASVWLLFLNAIFLDIYPTGAQVLAFVLAMIGTSFIAFNN